jgi:DNA-binding NtrC family response regulator
MELLRLKRGENKVVKKKIVVVDDDESIRQTFFLILNKNYLVYLAKDSKEALERFSKADIDLIIADLKLPYLNGVEMIAKFRELGYKGEVILVSAFPDLVKVDELSKLSISHFFVKPLDLDALNRSIDYLLNSKESPVERI